MSDQDLQAQLNKAGVSPQTATAILNETQPLASTDCAHHCLCSLLSR